MGYLNLYPLYIIKWREKEGKDDLIKKKLTWNIGVIMIYMIIIFAHGRIPKEICDYQRET